MPRYALGLDYGTESARRRYFRYAFPLGFLVWAAFGASLGVPRLGTGLITLYLTWSPWHYTGQNYGIALLFLGRHGVPLDPRTKALLRGSFWLSYAVTFLFIHSPYTFDPFRMVHVRFLSLNLPALVADLGIFVALLGYGATTALVTASLLRAGGRRAAPALALDTPQCGHRRERTANERASCPRTPMVARTRALPFEDILHRAIGARAEWAEARL